MLQYQYSGTSVSRIYQTVDTVMNGNGFKKIYKCHGHLRSHIGIEITAPNKVNAFEMNL